MSEVRAPRVIESAAQTAFERWELPAVEGHSAAPRNVLSTRELETIQKRAWDEGLARGEQEGRARSAQLAERLEAILAAMSRPFQEFNDLAEQELMMLAKTLARGMVRRELRADPGEIIPVVRDALALLPSGAREITVRLHPEDAQLARSVLQSDGANRPWRIVDDAVLTRGDCRVTTETSQIDATLETRLNALLAETIGGNRSRESATGTSMSRGPRLDPIGESATGTSMSRGPHLDPIGDDAAGAES
jgi:flagellar assembly protein FliH